MAKKRNYIPQNDEQFDLFLKNLVQYAAKKCGGAKPEWTHIPKKALDDLAAVYAAWRAAYEPVLQPHTQPETVEKNRVKMAAQKSLRDFVNEFLRYSSQVTPQDRGNMGVSSGRNAPSPIPRPASAPEFSARPRENRILEIDFREEGSSGKAKPYGCDGALVCWGIPDAAPARPEELANHELATKTPYTAQFDETERGRRVYLALRWQNNKGELGPWSDIQSTVVP